jgi:hypothetical protein
MGTERDNLPSFSFTSKELDLYIGSVVKEASMIRSEAESAVEGFGFNSRLENLFNLALTLYLLKNDYLGGKINPAEKFVAKALGLENELNEMYSKMNQLAIKRVALIIENDLSEKEDPSDPNPYLPNTVLNAANFVASFWLQSGKKKKIFRQTIEDKVGYLKRKVLRPKQ